MVAHVRAFSQTNPHPQVRQIDPWRDGRAVANLLEAAFRDDVIDEGGERMLNQLRNYGVFDAVSFGFGTGFVWVEGSDVVANASVQRNFTRKDTWMIGNVATRVDMRNHGIGRALLDACIRYAVGKGARFVALQADAGNMPALHLYEKAGFDRVGDVAHYTRQSARRTQDDSTYALPIRKAGWSDREAIWSLARDNVSEELTFAESFDSSVYRLGFRWSLANTFNGNLEQWFVLPPMLHSPSQLAGAIRTRANLEGGMHHLELLLRDDTPAEQGLLLIERGLRRLDNYITKPVYAAQARPHDATHTALQAAGFVNSRALAHMLLKIGNG